MADKTLSSQERILAAIRATESAFFIPSNDPLRIEEHWLRFDDGREKVAVIWIPPAVGIAMHKAGFFVVLDTTPEDIQTLREALKAVGTPLFAKAPFLVRLSAKGLAEAML